MATYKVIQDIEAEDHLIGPLSFRQFVYALIAIFLLYLNFLFLTKGVALLMIVALPPALFTGFLAFPFGKDQPTEVWALGKLRYLVKPHRRIWNQTGVQELVTVTVPKKIERNYTNGLNQAEVKSRLQALADTIDSRGWVIKNVNLNSAIQMSQTEPDSDRLIDPASMPQAVPDYTMNAADDIMDEHSNPTAQHMEQMVSDASTAHHQQLLETMRQAGAHPGQMGLQLPQPEAYWFAQPTLNQGQASAAQQSSQSGPVATVSNAGFGEPSAADEQAVLERVQAQNKSEQLSNGNLHAFQPTQPVARPVPAPTNTSPAPLAMPVAKSVAPAQTTQTPANPPAGTPAVTAQPDPAILNLANNNDLNVATLAREIHKTRSPEPPQNEVVISLH